MGLALAIKRGARALVPPSLSRPKTLVGRQLVPAFFYLIGLETGMYVYARPGEGAHITTLGIIAFSILLVLKWWCGSSTGEPAEA